MVRENYGGYLYIRGNRSFGLRERDRTGIFGGMENTALNLPVATRRPDAPLTALQARFVEHYLRYRNATQAYKFACDKPDINYHTAASEGGKLLRDERVQEAIRVGAKEAFKGTSASVGWLLQRFLDIATADPRELIGLKVGACRYCHGEGFGYQWREREYAEALEEAEREARLTPGHRAAAVRFPDIAGGFGYNATRPPHPDCPQCHGEGVERAVPRDTDNLSDQALLLFGGVKVKPGGGYEIIIADRQKALENVGRIMGAFTDKVQHSGAIGALVAVDDLRKQDPVAAAKAYRDMIAGNLTVSS